MKFYLKDNKNVCVKGDKAVNAATKLIRKMIRRLEEKNEEYMGFQDELILIDQNNKEHHYIFKIVKNDGEKKYTYGDFSYCIVYFKKLALK